MNNTELSFIQNLKDLMYKNNINQTELANKLGVTKATVSGWLSGKYVPRANVAQDICNIFGVEMSDLLTKKEPAEIDRLKNEIMTVFRGLDEDGQKQLLAYARFLAQGQAEE